MVVNRFKNMGARGGGRGRGGRGGGGGTNPYRQEDDRPYRGQINDLEGAIKDVISGGKYAKGAAEFLRTELKGASPAAVAQAKQMVKSNTFAYMTTPEIGAIRKGAYSAAALKMKSKINKALNSIQA